MDIEFGQMTKRQLCAALTEVAEAASRDTLDDDMLGRLDPNSYAVGRVDVANRILQIIAKHDAGSRA